MIDFKLFGNGRSTLTRLMAATIAFLRSLLMSYLLGIVLTHLKAPDQQTTTSAFIQVLTLADDQLTYLISSA